MEIETVEKDEINWLLTCRICLKSEDQNMKCIFSDDTFPEDIATKIIICGGVPVNIFDGMPDRICDRCYFDLEIAYKFRNACQQSYKRLNKMVNAKETKSLKCGDVSIAVLKTESDGDENQTKYSELIEMPKDISQRESFEMLYVDEETLVENYSQESDLEEDDSESRLDETEDCADKSKPNGKELNDKCELTPGKGLRRLRKDKSSSIATNYICYLCGNLYTNKSKLSQHIKLHTAEKPHECEICAKKFAQAAQLSRHMNSHTGNRPYKCKYCPSSFADPSTCIKHERIHTNDRPFKCLECGKSFAYSNVLKVHQKTHTGEKPFSCSICDKKFTQQHHKKSHEKTHFNVAIGSKSEK